MGLFFNFIMEKTLYADDFIVSVEGMTMRFGDIKGWIEMGRITYDDIRPAAYDEIVHYSEVQRREK